MYHRDIDKRQATRHDCLPSLLGDRDKELKNMYGEEKYCFVLITDLTRAVKARQKSLVPAQGAQRTNQEEPLSFVLFESPFVSDSTVSLGHPSLFSLVIPGVPRSAYIPGANL